VGPTCEREKREKALLLECTNLKRRCLLVDAPGQLGPTGSSGGGGSLGEAGLAW
jgi:hypothetical protein